MKRKKYYLRLETDFHISERDVWDSLTGDCVGCGLGYGNKNGNGYGLFHWNGDGNGNGNDYGGWGARNEDGSDRYGKGYGYFIIEEEDEE